MMKTKFYTVLSRDEFIKLYRFGHIFINYSYLIKEKDNKDEKLLELFSRLPFEYEEGYLILKIETNTPHSFDSVPLVYNLTIEEIISIYTLSNKAKDFYTTKVVSKIKYQIYPSQTLLNNILEYKEKEDMKQGINILAKVFDFMDINKLDNTFGNKFLNSYINLMKKDNCYLNNNYNDFYLDLLLYKREDKFQKEDISYIYDSIIIIILKEKKEKKYINIFKQGQFKNQILKNVKTYEYLNENKKETLFELIDFIYKEKENEILKKFFEKISISEFIAGTLYLKIKDLLEEKQYEEMEKLIDSFSSRYKKELSISLYLIGIIFGYEHLYEYYYDFIKLNIYEESVENYNIEYETKENNNIDILELSQKDGLANFYYHSKCNNKQKNKLKDLKLLSEEELKDKINKCYEINKQQQNSLNLYSKK